MHRDIKPQNIIIADGRVPILIDFGLSFNVEEDFATTFAGTVPYLSPEHLLPGNVGMDAGSDLYSLAVSFYELLSGTVVVDRVGKNAKQIFQEIASSVVPRISSRSRGIPPTLDPIFDRSLRKMSHERYASGEELAEDINDWLEDQRPRHAGETRRARIWRRRNPLLALCSLALVCLLAWGVVAYQSKQSRLERAADVLEESARWDAEGNTKKAIQVIRDGEEELSQHPTTGARLEVLAKKRSVELYNGILSSTALVFADSRQSQAHDAWAAEAAALADLLPHDMRLLLVRAYAAYVGRRYQEAIRLIRSRRPESVRYPPLVSLASLAFVRLGDLKAGRKWIKETSRIASAEDQVAANAFDCARLLAQRPNRRLRQRRHAKWRRRSKELLARLMPLSKRLVGSARAPRILVAVSLQLQMEDGDLAEAIKDADYLEDESQEGVDDFACRLIRLELALRKIAEELETKEQDSHEQRRRFVDAAWSQEVEDRVARIYKIARESGFSAIEHISKVIVRVFNDLIAQRWWRTLERLQQQGQEFPMAYFTVDSGMLAVAKVANENDDVRFVLLAQVLEDAGVGRAKRFDPAMIFDSKAEKDFARGTDEFVVIFRASLLGSYVRLATAAIKQSDPAAAKAHVDRGRSVMESESERQERTTGLARVYHWIFTILADRAGHGVAEQTNAAKMELGRLLKVGIAGHEVHRQGGWEGWREQRGQYKIFEATCREILELEKARP